MSKFNVGDKVYIAGYFPDAWPEESLKDYYESKYGKCFGTVTTVTAIEKVPWNDFEYFYRLESNSFRWFDFELKLVQDNIKPVTEDDVLELLK